MNTILLGLLVATVQAEPPAEIKAYIEAVREQRAKTIKKAETEIARAKTKARATKDRTQRRQLGREIKQLTAKLKKLKREPPPPVKLDVTKLKRGQIGKLYTPDLGAVPGFSVFNVASDGYLCEAHYTIRAATGKRITIGGVSQLQTRREPRTVLLFVPGSTDGLVDGQQVELYGIYKVSEPHTYVTASGGQKTVPTIVPFDTKPFEHLLK